MKMTTRNWWILLVVSVGVMVPFVVPYIALDPERSRIPIASVGIQYPLLVAHIASALVALLTGFMQFLHGLRISKPHIHRLLGRVYATSVGISGLLALGIIGYESDYTKAMSFLALDLIWLFTTWKGYRTAVNRQWERHREWMLRSFGTTLVAVGHAFSFRF